MAALFAGRGFQAGERDATRLTTYLALFREAQAKQCFPLQLQAAQARIINQLRTAGGISEREILANKAKNVFTNVALYLMSDGASFDTISNDHGRWSDDKGMRATVQAGVGLFIYTGADGTIRLEARVVDALPSGRFRLGQPLAKSEECLEVDVDPGVYRVALYNLSYGEKCVVIAARTDLEIATNQQPESEPRYGQSIGGILNT